MTNETQDVIDATTCALHSILAADDAAHQDANEANYPSNEAGLLQMAFDIADAHDNMRRGIELVLEALTV